MTLLRPVRSEPFRTRTPMPVALRIVFWSQLAQALLRIAVEAVGLAEFDTSRYGVGASIFGVLFSLAVAAFWAWIPFLLRRGVGWARVVTAVASGLAVAYCIPNFPNPVALVSAALALATIVLLWVPPTNAFFAAVKSQRAQYLAGQLPLEEKPFGKSGR